MMFEAKAPLIFMLTGLSTWHGCTMWGPILLKVPCIEVVIVLRHLQRTNRRIEIVSLFLPMCWNLLLGVLSLL